MNNMEREVWETLQQMVAEGSVVVVGHDEEGRELYSLQEQTTTTPLPWQVGGYDGKDGVTYITGPSGELVAGMGDAGYEPDKQTPRNNAELIVRAVNAYTERMANLNELADYYRQDAAKRWVQQQAAWSDDEGMLEMFEADYRDHLRVVSYIRNGESDKAKRALWNMETAAREECPDRIFDFLEVDLLNRGDAS